METSELLKKVRKIEIKSRGLTNHIFSGHYHSAFKGKGMTFSEVREYQYGDDVRSIDWNVTARLNHPYVKIFEEERELTVMLLIDVSGSNKFGTQKQFKEDLITEIAAVLSFSAIQNNDKVGVIFFSDKIEKFITPKKGSSHILRIIRELINFTPTNNKTDIAEALRYFTNVIKKKCTAFLISDFMDNGFEDAIKITSKKHDLVAVRVYDELESHLPDIGMVKLKNAEDGTTLWVDSSDTQVRKNFQTWWMQHEKYLNDVFVKSGTDEVKINTNQDYVKPLMNLFKKRENRN
ncbi:MAG: DUF58 domain-containing protein [Bacteroidetes bacterium]|nr:DUF58 domain-containing protein [Bacteroidota bacterium]